MRCPVSPATESFQNTSLIPFRTRRSCTEYGVWGRMKALRLSLLYDNCKLPRVSISGSERAPIPYFHPCSWFPESRHGLDLYSVPYCAVDSKEPQCDVSLPMTRGDMYEAHNISIVTLTARLNFSQFILSPGRVVAGVHPSGKPMPNFAGTAKFLQYPVQSLMRFQCLCS